MAKHIKAPVGTKMSCKNWQSEAAMRMLMNNLDDCLAIGDQKRQLQDAMSEVSIPGASAASGASAAPSAG